MTASTEVDTKTFTAGGADRAPADTGRLPLGALMALSAAGFITLMTEVMPAGLLLPIGASLGTSPGMTGQLVTVYAAGSLLTAIPLTALTRDLGRRLLLTLAVGGFAIVNTVTAVSDSFILTLVARFFAGAFGGLVWALLVGYAIRLSPAHLAGRAIALTGLGAPLAFSFGVPAGAFIGSVIGWRLAFGLMSLVALGLAAWIATRLPELPGERGGARLSPAKVLAMPGLAAVLTSLFAFVTAHNVLYTYIAPFLGLSGLGGRVDLVLLAFGLAGLAGLWLAGAYVDRALRPMLLASTAILAVAALGAGFGHMTAGIVLAAIVVWGIVVGAAPTLYQTATAKAAGDAGDVAQAMLVTTWNLAVAAGGAVGGFALTALGATALPVVTAVLALAALAFALGTRARTGG